MFVLSFVPLINVKKKKKKENEKIKVQSIAVIHTQK